MDDKQFHGPYSFNLNEAYNVHILVHYKELCTQLVIPEAKFIARKFHIPLHHSQGI